MWLSDLTVCESWPGKSQLRVLPGRIVPADSDLVNCYRIRVMMPSEFQPTCAAQARHSTRVTRRKHKRKRLIFKMKREKRSARPASDPNNRLQLSIKICQFKYIAVCMSTFT